MLGIQENSIGFKTVVFRPTSVIPIVRINEIRSVLRNFQIDWGVILVEMYPSEFKKIFYEFPELTFNILNEDSNYSNTIPLSISRNLN